MKGLHKEIAMSQYGEDVRDKSLEVVQHIAGAFREVTIHCNEFGPQRELASWQRPQGETLGGCLHWSSVPDDWIEYNYDENPFFSSRETLFFLPAYMTYALVNLGTRSNVLPFLVYSLASVRPGRASERRFALLSEEQRRTVALFLETVVQCYYPEQPMKEAVQALAGYWHSYSSIPKSSDSDAQHRANDGRGADGSHT